MHNQKLIHVIINRREKPRKRSYKRYLVRPLQDRLIGTKRSYATCESPFHSKSSSKSAVFLEVEEESGRPVTVLRPLPSGDLYQGTPQLVNNKRRSCRVKVLSYTPSQQHRRSWSVGGSNVHQTMMRRSESHLRRLGNITEKKGQDQRDSRPSSSTSSCSRSSSDRRNSALVDAGTQTLVHEEDDAVMIDGQAEESRRSKGDGVESPAMIGRIKRDQQVRTFDSSDSDEDDASREIEEETYRWERKRGRASGSSQHITLCETSSQSLSEYSHPMGRRYTVDMSQYKYNDSWTKRVHEPSGDPTQINSSSLPNKGKITTNLWSMLTR